MKKSIKKILRAILIAIAVVALCAATGSAPEWSGFHQYIYSVGCMLIFTACYYGVEALER